MITLNQNEMAAIHAMQNGEQITKQDLVFLDVAASKILSNAKELRKKLGIKHHCTPRHTNITLAEKLKIFLKEPKSEAELIVFMKSKNKHSMLTTISHTRVKNRLCFCKVSPNHWQYLPEYDGVDGCPTSFGNFIAIQMILNRGRLSREVLTAKYGVPKSKIENVLALGRNHKKRFQKFLELVSKKNIQTRHTHSGYKKDLDNVHCAM